MKQRIFQMQAIMTYKDCNNNSEGADAGATGKSSAAVWLPILLTIGAALRISHGDLFHYNSDEAMHAAIASGASVSEVLRFAHYEIHPPLLYLLAHYWGILSTAPSFMRGLPLVFGLALIPLYYVIGKKLAGVQAGLGCAVLVTFSNGCIIQSYVLRQYMPFVFFLSLALLALLYWRERPRLRRLAAYVLCATFACCAHFSAIFAIAVMAVSESWRMVRASAPGRLRACWLGANAGVTALACLLYRNWQPVFKPLQSYFDQGRPALSERLLPALSYPLEEIAYVSPGGSMAIAAFTVAGLIVALMRRGGNGENESSEYKTLLRLGFWALAFGAILYATGIYPVSGTRRNLWLLPFIVPPMGYAAVAFAQYCLRVLTVNTLSEATRKKPERASMSIGLLVVAGLLLYSPARRFADGSEYVWQQDVWQDFSRAMQELGPEDVIVTEKDDGIMLANLYSAMGPDVFTGASMLAAKPYGRTQILFNPYYPRNYTSAIFLAGLQQAERQHQLDGIKRVVFLRMAWSRSPLTDLMTCPALRKEIRTFPDFGPDPSRDDIERARAAILIASVQTVRDAILAPAGAARKCLKDPNKP